MFRRFLSSLALATFVFSSACTPKPADSSTGADSLPPVIEEETSEASIFLHAKIDSLLSTIQSSDSKRIAKSIELIEMMGECKLLDANGLSSLTSSIAWLKAHQTSAVMPEKTRAAYDSVETKTLVEMQEAMQAKSKCENGIILSGLLHEIQLADDSVLLYRLQHDNFADAYNALDTTASKKARKVAVFRLNP